MSDQDIEKLLQNVLSKMKSNDGNNNLLIEIRHNLETIKTDNHRTDKKLDEIKEALYDPDEGVYRRINKQSSDIDELKQQAHHFKRNEEKLVAVENTTKTLKNIAGEDLEHLRSSVDSKKKHDKLVIVMISAAVAGLIKTIWDIISSLPM